MTVYLGKNPVGVGRIVEKKVAKEKYGATIDNLLGNVDENGVYSKPTEPFAFDGSAIKEIGYYGLSYMFNNNQATSVDLSSLTTVSDYGLYYAFMDNKITSVDLSSLTTLGRYGLCYAFMGNKITSVDLSSLTTVGYYGLRYAFANNTALTDIYFRVLKSDSFGSYTNQFTSMLSGVTGCTVHFPSNLESVIGSWSDVTTGFGGTNTVVLFDLPATE